MRHWEMKRLVIYGSRDTSLSYLPNRYKYRKELKNLVYQ